MKNLDVLFTAWYMFVLEIGGTVSLVTAVPNMAVLDALKD